ncbi:MAG: chemotaxis protein CheW [Treponemataceae bacterium]
MVFEEKYIHVVTFQLGNEFYGVNIKDVKEVVNIQHIRPILNAPLFIEGILNLRGEIIPIVNLSKRFNLETAPHLEDDDGFQSGFIIFNVANLKIGAVIDKIARVMVIQSSDVKAPPQMMTGIKGNHIIGVVRQESSYLILLDMVGLFSEKEIQQLADIKQ